MACGKCTFRDAKTDKRGRRIYSGDPTHACLAPEPELPALPESVRPYGFAWPPHRSYMGAEDGEGCAFFADWKTAPAGWPISPLPVSNGNYAWSQPYNV